MRGSQSVENMRAALMDLLGKGGTKLREFDNAYADRVMDVLYPQRIRDSGNGLDGLRGLAASYLGGGRAYVPEVDQYIQNPTLRGIETGARYAFPVTNIGVRYGLPVAGVTAAGQGLAELIDALDPEAVMEYHDEHLSIPFNPNS